MEKNSTWLDTTKISASIFQHLLLRYIFRSQNRKPPLSPTEFACPPPVRVEVNRTYYGRPIDNNVYIFSCHPDMADFNTRRWHTACDNWQENRKNKNDYILSTLSLSLSRRKSISGRKMETSLSERWMDSSGRNAMWKAAIVAGRGEEFKLTLRAQVSD